VSAAIQPAESYITKFAWTMKEYKDDPKKCTIWGSHNSGYEYFYLLGYNAVQFLESKITLIAKVENLPGRKPS
jgi:hypothetical protein